MLLDNDYSGIYAKLNNTHFKQKMYFNIFLKQQSRFDQDRIVLNSFTLPKIKKNFSLITVNLKSKNSVKKQFLN
jgi:hypothetical protein